MTVQEGYEIAYVVNEYYQSGGKIFAIEKIRELLNVPLAEARKVFSMIEYFFPMIEQSK